MLREQETIKPAAGGILVKQFSVTTEVPSTYELSYKQWEFLFSCPHFYHFACPLRLTHAAQIFFQLDCGTAPQSDFVLCMLLI